MVTWTQKPTAAERRKAEPVRPSDVSVLLPLLEMKNRIGDVYGSDDVCMLFYSLIRRERPKNVVEIGSGLGVTSLWMAQAMKEIGAGHVWTLDDGIDWQDPREFQAAIAPLAEVEPFVALDIPKLDYVLYLNNCIELLHCQDHLTFLPGHVDLTHEQAFTKERYPFLERPVDVIFHDITRAPDDVLDLLFLFLPYVAETSSIFIDSVSTSLTGYLFLEKLIDQLNHGKVPRRFLLGTSEVTRRTLVDLVSQRRFTLMHLIERKERPQNSTAWIKVEPNDYVPHPETLMKW